MNKKILDRLQYIKEPEHLGSYSKDDCIFLLKNINGLITEQGNEEREGLNQSGVHYSEMLPIEYVPTEEYFKLFRETLEDSAQKMADYVAVLAEKILKKNGENTVLVSLARAGTPIGVLLKRYIKFKYDLNLPHYSISIIRGKGFDENALCYILGKHPDSAIQFIDGWTGKGAITKVLQAGCEDFNSKYDTDLKPDLAVIADPAHCVSLCSTREDFLIPSACLNSTISGLVSRTVERKDIIGEYDFHGAKYYTEWEDVDDSNMYIDKVSTLFRKDVDWEYTEEEVTYKGWSDTERIMKDFDVTDINLIKPSVGECTRVLLRRLPWKILVDDINNPNLKLVILLAQNKGVPIEEYPNMSYSCIGIIKQIKK